MAMHDVDGQLLCIGNRVVAMDRVQGISLKIGTVMGFTAKGVKVDLEGDPKTYNKLPHQLVKMFNQKDKCGACDGRGWTKAPDDVMETCLACKGKGTK